jgi:hypothetical protein
MSEEKHMPPGFMTYKEAAIMFTLMGKEDAADAIQAACNYYLYGELPELTGTVLKVFEIEKAAIDKGRENYRAQVEGGRKSVNKRWENRRA